MLLIHRIHFAKGLLNSSFFKDSFCSFTTNFTTHGGSHLYGIPYLSVDYLEPMDHFCTFDVSKIIPKNMSYLLYATFIPILAYIRRFDRQTRIHWDVCKRPKIFGVFLDVDPSHLSRGLPYALRSLGFDLLLPH